MMAKYKTGFFNVSVFLWLIFILIGCSTAGMVRPEQANNDTAAGEVVIVQPGDTADINYLCRLQTGEVAAASNDIAETDVKSVIFVAGKEKGPLTISALRPDDPLPVNIEAPFEYEIVKRLERVIAGMKEGEKRRVELTAQEIPKRDEQNYVVRVTSFRESPREMKISKDDYKSRVGREPEAGQIFTVDPAFPGRVESVTDRDVVIRFHPKQDDVIPTAFGPGHIREDGQKYKLVIDAKKGNLIRTGDIIGYFSDVDDNMITIDYRHPFGNQTLFCDVTVNKVTKAEAAKKEGAKEK